MDKENKTPTLPKVDEYEPPKLPTLAEILDGIDNIGKTEGLNAILNSPPPQKWIKEHPFIPGHKYLPIDKTEYLLRKIFKRYKIKITGQGTAFNGVWVTVRVGYLDPSTGQWTYQEGIGAISLQLRAQTKEEKEQKIKVPFTSDNINNGALSMAFPLAKTLAVKDACQLIGNIFGGNIDRKDTIEFTPDPELIKKSRVELRKEKLIENGINV